MSQQQTPLSDGNLNFMIFLREPTVKKSEHGQDEIPLRAVSVL